MLNIGHHINKSSEIMKGFYPSSQMIFEKTGEEIKTALEKVLEAKKDKCEDIESQLNLLKTQIGSMPDRESVWYGGDSDNKSFPSYNIGWGKACDSSDNSFINEENKEAQVIENLKHKFNSLSNEYYDIESDEDKIELMVNNLELTKKYPLSISDLKTLGF